MSFKQMMGRALHSITNKVHQQASHQPTESYHTTINTVATPNQICSRYFLSYEKEKRREKIPSKCNDHKNQNAMLQRSEVVKQLLVTE